MTIADKFAAKLAVALVAVAMVFAAFAPAAQAQTTEELQAMINDLLAQVAELQSQTGQSGEGASAAGVCPYTWTRDLSQGSTGMDVMKLQQFLNSDPDTRVAAAGQVGSAGMETEYYGPATAAAVSKMQVKYRSEVLSPAGLVNPTGYFGPSSRAKANSVCVAPAPTPDDPEDDGDGEGTGSDDEEGSDEDEDDFNLRGSASLDDLEIDDVSDDDIEEGAEDAPIAEVTVDFENGDAEISRLDIALLGKDRKDTTSGSPRIEPFEAFEEISLWVDGDKIASVDADNEDDYLEEDEGTLRFNNLGLIAEEDEELEIIVAATVMNNLDNDEIGNWEAYVTEMRFFDADGVAETVDGGTTDIIAVGNLSGNSTDPSAEFELVEEGDDDELRIRTSSADPDSTTLELDDDETTDFGTIFAFDLDTDDSTNDVEVTQLQVGVNAFEGDGTTPTSTALLIDDIQLLVDGNEYDDVDITHGTSGVFLFDLDDEDFFIDAGDEVTVEFQAEFEALAPALEGATVQASVGTTNLLAEGADDITGSDLSGGATGDEHTLRTEGAILDFVSSTEDKDLKTDSTSNDDEGVFTLKFDVTAFENDLYVNKTAASGTSMGTDGVNFLITDGSGNVKGTTSANASLSSGASTETVGGTGRFKVAEGETEEFTLTINYDPGTSGFYGVQLYSLNFSTTNADPATQQRALPSEDYETDPLNI